MLFTKFFVAAAALVTVSKAHALKSAFDNRVPNSVAIVEANCERPGMNTLTIVREGERRVELVEDGVCREVFARHLGGTAGQTIEALIRTTCDAHWMSPTCQERIVDVQYIRTMSEKST